VPQCGAERRLALAGGYAALDPESRGTSTICTATPIQVLARDAGGRWSFD